MLKNKKAVKGKMNREISRGLMILAVIATLLLTASALTQDEFIAFSDYSSDKTEQSEKSKEVSKSPDENGDIKSEKETVTDETIQDSDSNINIKPEVKQETEIIEKQLSAMEEFLNFIKVKQKGDIELSDIKKIAKNTDEEVKEIDKKIKNIAIAEVSKKALDSDEVEIIVWVKKGYSHKIVARSLRNFELKHTFDKLNGFSGTASKSTISALKRDRRIDYIAFDAPVKAALAESVSLIEANIVSTNFSISGEGMGICHLDTGINYNIPELAHAYAGGFDFVNNDPDPFDDNGHGTVTAGVMVSNHPTEKGVTPQARLYVVKVLDANGFGFSSSVTAGINWCITNKDLLNISVIAAPVATFETYNQASHPGYSEVALQAAYNANIPVVACTGNTGNMSGVAYPAVSQYVIPVSGVYDENIGPFSYQYNNFSCSDSITSADQMPCFANRANFVDLVAPASIITTTSWFGGTMDISGTSVAAPHVASTIAMMKQRNPEMTVSQIKEILENTGENIYDNSSGLTFKRINSLEAVKAVPLLTTVGTLAQGNTINLEVSDPMNPGAIYFAVLSFGNDVGIPLPNGLTLPLNADGLFTYSLSPNPLITNNIGFLNSNGRATASVLIPPIPGIENFTLYAGFATARTDLSQFLSVSNSETL